MAPETPPRLMSAQDLIDPQALPSWMSGWQGRPGQANQQSRQSQPGQMAQSTWQGPPSQAAPGSGDSGAGLSARSEEHTSELQSQSNLVCRLLLEKKKKKNKKTSK